MEAELQLDQEQPEKIRDTNLENSSVTSDKNDVDVGNIII